PARRHAGTCGGAAVRRLRRGHRYGPHLQLRRGRRPVRGAQVPRHRLWFGVRAGGAEEALHRGHVRGGRDHRVHAGSLRRRGRRLRHRRPGPDQAHLPGGGRGHRGRVPAADRRRGRRIRAGGRRRAHAVARRPDRAAATSHYITTAPITYPSDYHVRPTLRGAPAVSMPFYVSPEQAMKDKADYARKGIARGRNSVVLAYDEGILFVAPNPSSALHKVSEIYDRIAFAAVGRYNEYENLRVAGVRFADTRGYQYAREDVTARGLANWYAQVLGSIFTESNKPYEVELVVAEVGDAQDEDQMYRITFDGSVADEHGFVAMGGQAEQVAVVLKERYATGLPMEAALGAAIAALSGQGNGERSEINGSQLEVAALMRGRAHRT